MSTPRYRDTSVDRRARAAACVERHLDELAAILGMEGLATRIVEGSAVSAEVYLAETNTLHTALRVAVYFSPRDKQTIEQALRRAGFKRGEPAGDVTLLRLAAHGGKRAVHVLFDGEGPEPSAAGGRSLHPGDPAAVRARAERLATAWIDITAAYRRVRTGVATEHDITESFEVQLIQAP